MPMSQDISNLAEALSKLQGTISSVPKNKQAIIPTKTGKPFSYSYADLSAIWDAIRQPLKENNLSISQTFVDRDKMIVLETILMHSSGQWISSSLPLGIYTKIQELGSEITYLRRYALSSILGICADDDTDAVETNEKKFTPYKEEKKAEVPSFSKFAQELEQEGIDTSHLNDFIETKAKEKGKSYSEILSAITNPKLYELFKSAYLKFIPADTFAL